MGGVVIHDPGAAKSIRGEVVVQNSLTAKTYTRSARNTKKSFIFFLASDKGPHRHDRHPKQVIVDKESAAILMKLKMIIIIISFIKLTSKVPTMNDFILRPHSLCLTTLLFLFACGPDENPASNQATQMVPPTTCDPGTPASETCPDLGDALTFDIIQPFTGTASTQPMVTLELEVLTGTLASLSVQHNNKPVDLSITSGVAGETIPVPLTLSPGLNTMMFTATPSKGDVQQRTLTLTYEQVAEPMAPRIIADVSGAPAQTWDAEFSFPVSVQSATAPELVLLTDGVETSSVTLAQDSEASSNWTGNVTVELVAGAHTYSLIASASGISSDPLLWSIERLVDDTPPTLQITSHVAQQDVLSRRQILRGVASDDTSIDRVELTLQDGTTLPITLDPQGHFSAEPALLQRGPNALSITVYDIAGNSTEIPLTLHYGSKLAAGGSHTGVLFDDVLYTFGRNNKGQLGLGFTSRIGDTNHAITPTEVATQGLTIAALSFSQNTSLALTSEGHVYAWGDNDEGQLGLGDAATMDFDDVDRLTPERVPGLEDVVAVVRGYDHSMALDAQGNVWTFGDNGDGQLGLGDEQSRDVPTQLPSLTHIVQIAAGSKSSYALDEQGNVWAWGRNRYGNLGQGTEDTNPHNAPAQITSLSDIIMLATGRDHVLALDARGQIWAWGLNASFQVGEETLGDPVTSPVERSDIDDVRAVYAHANQSFVLRTDSKLYGWGQNLNGTLGIANEEDVSTPNDPVFGLEDVRGAAIGALHGIAQTSTDEVFAWGWSFEGSLGSGGDTIDRWAYRVPLLVDLPYAP